MVFFGHIGITVGIVQAVNVRFKRHIDLRAAGLLALGPDLFDKPLGLLYPNVFGNHTRLYGHSALFALVLLVLFYARRRRFTEILPLWLCYAGHLILDRTWIFSKHYLYWPFIGRPPMRPPQIVKRFWEGAQTVYNLTGEALGLSILIYLVFHYMLYRKDRWKGFWRDGTLHSMDSRGSSSHKRTRNNARKS